MVDWPCLSPGELVRWTTANALCPPPVRACRPCDDCTELHVAATRLEGRCQGEPGPVDVAPPTRGVPVATADRGRG